MVQFLQKVQILIFIIFNDFYLIDYSYLNYVVSAQLVRIYSIIHLFLNKILRVLK